jgi:hypothetical protein
MGLKAHKYRLIFITKTLTLLIYDGSKFYVD